MINETTHADSSAAAEGYVAANKEDGIVLYGKLTGVKLHRNANGQCKVILETGEGIALHAHTVIIDSAEQIDHWVAVDQQTARRSAANQTTMKRAMETPTTEKRETKTPCDDVERVVMWAYAENIVWALVFLAILLFLDGWARTWAVVPLLFMNIHGPDTPG